MRLAVSLKPRERRLTLVVAIVIGCWGLLSCVVHPLREGLRDLTLRIETQTQKLDALLRLLAQAPTIERDYERYAPYLQAPVGEETQGAFLEDLEALSRRANVQLNLKPRAGSREDRVSRLEVELDAEGSQSNLMGFLDALLRMPSLIIVQRLQLSVAPAKPDTLHANLVIQKLVLAR